MTKNNNLIWVIGILLVMVLLVGPQVGLFSTQIPNPAPVYCEEQGGISEIRTNPDGSQTGYCLFSDGFECEEWAFYRGECDSRTLIKTVCCKIQVVSPGTEPTYTWQKENYCSSVINGKPLLGASRIIVDNLYCEKKCLFTINDYCIKLWILLLGLGVILLIIILSRKK